MKLLYDGIDIYPKVSINRCFHTMYAEGHADELLIRFNDTRKLWEKWKPERGHKLAVEDGTAKSGTMFIESITPQSGFLTIRAYSNPPTIHNLRSKSWEEVKLSQLIDEVSGEHGLSVQKFGFEDETYSFVLQNNEADFDFLSKRLAYEGLSFIVYDEKLVVYSQKYLESQAASKKLNISLGYNFEYRDNGDKAYQSCKVKNGTISGEYSIGSGKALQLVLPVPMTDETEANRFAKNLLRNKNKNMQTATIWLDYMARDLAAGANVTLKTEGAAGWDGKAFLYQVRHDYVFTKSKLWLRKPLDY